MIATTVVLLLLIITPEGPAVRMTPAPDAATCTAAGEAFLEADSPEIPAGKRYALCAAMPVAGRDA